MIKRFLATMAFILFFISNVLNFIPSKAAITSVDYGEMLNIYLGAAETALAASQGVTIDWSGIDMPAGSDTWTDQQKAQYVVSYIGTLKKVGQHAIYEWLFGEDNDTFDVVSAQTAAIGLAKNSNIDTQDIKAQLDNILATQSQDHVFQRYSDKVIAKWNEYNTNYINEYLEDMTVVPDRPTPPSPDADFVSQITYINDTGFIIKNYTNFRFSSYPAGMYYYYVFPLDNLTWTSTNNFTTWRSNQMLTININGSDNTYTFITTENLINNMCYSSPDDWRNNGDINQSAYINSGRPYLTANNQVSTTTYTYTGTLQQVFNYIQSHFRNVNIYVNGTPWALPGYVIDNPQIQVSVPDAVIDNSSEDGKIVAHPIYYPDTMDTDKAIDIDLDKVIDAIASRITQGDTDITFDDLVDAGAAVKLDGTTLTDADTVVKDVSIPIAKARVDTINGVIPTIDVVPPLPPLPPLTPGDYSGEGFNGMSVLARIINATVQGLPEPLILTFFGVVFGAVILGIIKILHH